jgi:hypothetical protein
MRPAVVQRPTGEGLCAAAFAVGKHEEDDRAPIHGRSAIRPPATDDPSIERTRTVSDGTDWI